MIKPESRIQLHCGDLNAFSSLFLMHPAGGLGLTAILAAKAEPWRAWAAHLAGFGAQAALVADSPYYKLLIGRMLGYKEEHIHHHIQARHMSGGELCFMYLSPCPSTASYCRMQGGAHPPPHSGDSPVIVSEG
jgi:hypothetical protein